MTADMDQTLELAKIKRPVDLGPTDVPKYPFHGDQISRSMNHLLTNFERVSPFYVWTPQFDKLKRALNYVASMLWICYFASNSLIFTAFIY